MFRRARARYRQVAPTLDRTAVLVASFCAFEGGIYLLERRNIPIGAALPFRPGAAILFVATAMHGLFRAFGLHPIWNGEYLSWLKLTPWTSRKPLPMGPVELIWADGVFVGGLLLLSATLPQPRAMQLLNVFLLCHLAGLTLTLWLTRTPAFGYTAAFGLGLALRWWHQPMACLAAATAVYMLAYEGLRRGFARFPWDPVNLKKLNPSTDMSKGVEQAEPCGWPYDQIMRDLDTERRISPLDAVLGCMLATWWLFVITSLIDNPNGRVGALAVALGAATVGGSIARLGIYVQGYQSPLKLWARIVTFRLIIPGYDQVFVAPLCTLLVGPIALGALAAARLPVEIAFSTATGLALLVALIAPPRLRRWRLTGRHRMVAVVPQNLASTQALVKVG
jgi:hypothetical protein